ncbi:flagellar basal-body MS-ring/collar protein FliF [Limobrevibacterium gyesilva]|uniref:Flagellar M-ring protein n=1 Tax=Limobrevibacterium gyesilva TaxID=2991712 RepID=A0AA42CD55_9PROT|nr:flagellar basal-body MS-ring/collar protein FliF [Limobrevibacterium gyesilva]MCW3473284.1 flagellar basal-body MS-ring/collar protein FliF [Limobrevibacterium gyesilva]
MTPLIQSLMALGPARLIALGVATVITFMLIALLAFRSPEERMALLYADLDLRDSSQIVERLDRLHISYQLRDGGSQILVPADQVTRSRVLLAKDSLPVGGSVGYEIFDRGDGFASNQFQQRMSQLRALEGELGRTIRTISGIRGARVHLVLPVREPFTREKQEAQASVMLTTGAAAPLDQESVQAIINLLTAAVPGLRRQNVAITDNHGTLLASARDQDQNSQLQSTETMRRNLEVRLARAVEQMLERSLGPGHVRAEVTADVDFERVNESQERFDPENQVARSMQAVTAGIKTTESSQNVSVQNNLPNADAGSTPSGSQENRQEETTNYEIGKTMRTIVREQALVRRLSIAVMVDGADERSPDGTVTWRPRTADELERIGRLVRSAVGFDQRRGDQLDVINLRFAFGDPVPPPHPALFLGLPIDKPDLQGLARILIMGLIAVAVLLTVLRPLVLRLSTATGQNYPSLAPSFANSSAVPYGSLESADTEAVGGRHRLLQGPSLSSIASADLAQQAGRSGVTDPLTSRGDSDESMIQIANIEGQLRASSIRKLSALVERHPDESLSIIRAWLQQDPG